MSSQYLTKEGLEKLKNELEDLENNKLPQVAERIGIAKELGDLSENAEYQDAKDEQGFIVGRVAEIKQIIKKAEIIKKDSNKDQVTIGCTIRILCESKEHEYTITGSNEADPIKGLISNESPLGRSFLGAKVGDKITVEVPKGEMVCEILEIK